MSKVRIVNKHGHGITLDVPEAETTSEAVGMLADFMGAEVYFTGEEHPHNDAVHRLLLDRREAAATALEDAQKQLWEFRAANPLP